MSPSWSPVEVPPDASLISDQRQGVRHRFSRRGGGLYVPLAERNALAIAGALLWAAVSIVLSLSWIGDLGRALTVPVAIAVVAGIAIVPGYLNAHLIASLLLDRPPPVLDGDTTRSPITLRGTLVAQGAFSVYRTEAVRAVGGWPDMIGEDIVLTWAMLDRGGRTTYEPTAIAFTDVPTSLRGLVRQRRRWARGMIGLRRHGARLLGSRRLYAHAGGVNFTFPLLDLTFTLAFPAGLILAATGNFMVVGPMTLAVMPLNAMIIGLMYRKQRRVFAALGLRVRQHRIGLLAYWLLLSPVSLSGYLTELVRRPRRW